MFELPFWLSLLIWSMLPETKTPLVEIASIPIDFKGIILVTVACFYLLPITNKSNINNNLYRPWQWHAHLPILTVILLSYAAVSVEISNLDEQNVIAMLYTLVLTASSFFLGYTLITKMSAESVRLFLWKITVYLAVLGLIYSVTSMFNFSIGNVRSTVGDAANGLGLAQRVAGPLFGASNGYFILIPALGFSIQEFLKSSTQRLFKLIVIIFLIITIIGLSSRAALLIIGIFFILAIFFVTNKRQVVAMSIIIVLATVIALGLVISKANSERLNSFEDSLRLDNSLTSFQIIAHRSAIFNISGSGYGSYWSWYLLDTEKAKLDVEKANSQSISEITAPRRINLGYFNGYLLYHAHSTFLLLIVELGAIGLLYFLYLWTVLAQLLFRNPQIAKFPIFTCNVVASGFSMFFDLFIFRSAQLCSLWWIFLFGALALNSSVVVPANRKSITTSTKNDIY